MAEFRIVKEMRFQEDVALEADEVGDWLYGVGVAQIRNMFPL